MKYHTNSIKLIIVIPKMTITLSNHKYYYKELYNEIIILSESDSVHYKSMVTIRNCCMVNISNCVVT